MLRWATCSIWCLRSWTTCLLELRPEDFPYFSCSCATWDETCFVRDAMMNSISSSSGNSLVSSCQRIFQGKTIKSDMIGNQVKFIFTSIARSLSSSGHGVLPNVDSARSIQQNASDASVERKRLFSFLLTKAGRNQLCQEQELGSNI